MSTQGGPPGPGAGRDGWDTWASADAAAGILGRDYVDGQMAGAVDPLERAAQLDGEAAFMRSIAEQQAGASAPLADEVPIDPPAPRAKAGDDEPSEFMRELTGLEALRKSGDLDKLLYTGDPEEDFPEAFRFSATETPNERERLRRRFREQIIASETAKRIARRQHYADLASRIVFDDETGSWIGPPTVKHTRDGRMVRTRDVISAEWANNIRAKARDIEAWDRQRRQEAQQQQVKSEAAWEEVLERNKRMRRHHPFKFRRQLREAQRWVESGGSDV